MLINCLEDYCNKHFMKNGVFKIDNIKKLMFLIVLKCNSVVVLNI